MQTKRKLASQQIWKTSYLLRIAELIGKNYCISSGLVFGVNKGVDATETVRNAYSFERKTKRMTALKKNSNCFLKQMQ